MVAGIPHDIVFGMYHVGFMGIPHDHVVFFLAMRYAFLTMRYAVFKTFENFNLGYLNVRNHYYHSSIKGKPSLGVAWGHTPLKSPAALHSFFISLMWHCWAPNSWSMAPHTKQSFGFPLLPIINTLRESTIMVGVGEGAGWNVQWW